MCTCGAQEDDKRSTAGSRFNTHAEFGVGSGFQTVQRLCPNSSVLSGLSIEGGYEKRGRLLVLQGDKARQAEQPVGQWLTRHRVA